MSRRELLQTLRLALLADDIRIPLARQGRGAQRLLLVSVLLRLAVVGGRVPIGGFEEPEEALEPVRQTQLAHMLRDVADRGGQIFIVTHSPDIARAFDIDDCLLLGAGTAGADARQLRVTISPPVRQTYERRLDGPIVRALFARIPLLVEGPGDRGVVEALWMALESSGEVPPGAQLGLDVINAEGAPAMPMLARSLAEAGKSVAALIDDDTDEVRAVAERLRGEGHCRLLLVQHAGIGRADLEGALAASTPLTALAVALEQLATDRGYGWPEQRTDLVSRLDAVGTEQRERVKAASSLSEVFDALGEAASRELAAGALRAKSVAPFEMKGARQGRLVAEAIAQHSGVPETFRVALLAVAAWVGAGCPAGEEIELVGAAPST